MTHLKYKGKNQKPVLTEQVLKRGARIMDRVMIFELLRGQEGDTGALGVDTREGRLIEFQAKSVILGTGAVVRLYPGMTPAIMGNNTRPFTLTGDGRSMAYRAGAELVNVELFSNMPGSRTCRSGQAPGQCLQGPEGNRSANTSISQTKVWDIIIGLINGSSNATCQGKDRSTWTVQVFQNRTMPTLSRDSSMRQYRPVEHLKEGVDLRKNW
jgi:hypothetical protein